MRQSFSRLLGATPCPQSRSEMGQLRYPTTNARSPREAAMPPVRVDVSTATGGYSVLIGAGLTDRLDTLLDEWRIGPRRFVVSNPVVWRIHGERFAQGLPDAEIILVPDGERHKHLASVARIYEALVRTGADRGSVVIAVGGGVIGDMAGFAAATYLRGVDLVHVPTTLLAQVDASVGGKVGVNLAAGKNLVGAFYPPRLVVTDPAALGTLPRREYRAGLYEVIKYGMACSADLFAQLERQAARLADPSADFVPHIVAECCRIKATIVSADEREAGERRVLNFGHTVGHAVEALTLYRRFRHGEAVAWGMLVAAQVAVGRGLLSEAGSRALKALVMKLGPLPNIADLSAARVLELARRDKKTVNGLLHVVLPAGVGSTRIVDDVSEIELTQALVRVGFGS
jgi:3-dehydroquinate synthase